MLVTPTSKHRCKTTSVDETRTQSSPHTRHTLLGDSLSYDVNRSRELSGYMLRLNKLKLEFAFNYFCGMCDGYTGMRLAK